MNVYSYALPGSANSGIAQGSIFAISGSGFTSTTSGPQKLPLPNRLEGVVVQVGTDSYENIIPLYYVSPTWIVGVLPSYFTTGPATLEVSGNGRRTGSIPFKIVQSAFGIATLNGSGSGPAAAYDAESKILSSVNSTRPGAAIQILGTGVGPITGDDAAQPTPADMIDIPMTAEVGGVSARILYRGRSTSPGLDRIDIEIPSLASGMFGCSVPLVIKSGDIPSNTATVPVSQNGGPCPNSSELTQNEIDRWSAAGTYTTGHIWLIRSTFNQITSDDTYGEFRRLSGPDVARSLRNDAGVAPPAAGQCFFGWPNAYPNIVSADLDAGPSIRSMGPNGSQIAPKGIDHFSHSSYFTDGSMNTYLTPGRYTVSGPGGPDVGIFSGTLDAPAEFLWTNWEEAKVVTRANGLTIRWTGGDPTQLVHISGISNYFGGVVAANVFHCFADNSDGQFTVPASILNQMPASSGFAYVYLVTTTAGARLEAPGIDYFTAVTEWDVFLRNEFK